MNRYRRLSDKEIEILIGAGCRAEDWSAIEVAEGFDPSRVSNVSFSGKVRLGSTDYCFAVKGGISRHSEIRNASLHNVTVGDGCYISNVNNFIANYEIGDRCYIENVGVLYVDGECSFGNGVKVSVLNETGGREVTIYDQLSSHQAYMQALYRHRPEFIAGLDALVNKYTESVKSCTGLIGNDVTIVNTDSISGVRIGDSALIRGALRLNNGSICSKKEAPVVIGQGVMLDDFIVCSDSKVEDCAMMSRCFIGQACRFGHSYSASDSLFFSNCQGENGEACAIFAGPFTVTHHKSTLLIAGIFSFMNAGSGSNQSNHMYKLGPIHQGTLERGAKTASDSYILWPARVGAFSLVMGRHVGHSDTSNLPFSYLIENKNATYLVPGVNLRSVGTIRDAQKWPKRDSRHDNERFDCINYNLLSPFTIQKMMKGKSILQEIVSASGELSDVYSFHSTKITNSALRKGIGYYDIAIDKFMGNSFISRLQDPDGSFSISSEEELRSRLKPDTPIGSGEWVDLSGLIAPKSEIDALMKDIEGGNITDLSQINAAFRKMHEEYYSYEWTWAFQHFQEVFGINPSRLTKEDAVKIIERWRNAVIKLDRMVYEDAKKEFNLASKTGFGADGGRQRKELDFENVRGDFESNAFVKTVLKHIDSKNELGDRAIEAVSRCL
ncbi:MAG: DUF4954 family protein [Bacteroidales bacterium]|nr:DUF4954 family protein [Bacteroidales bacterium]MCI5619768.1 DUF4954 family protein [Rikenellaceae bacterium]